MSFKKILTSFVLWRVLLLLFALFSFSALSLQKGFLGGDLANYLQRPLLWGWANFDGVHYIDIAQKGYRPLTYFFFPGFIVTIKYVSILFNSYNQFGLLISGLLVSNIIFFLGLLGFVKLAALDYDEKVQKWSLVLLLLFPTSLFFASVYTESFFFFSAIFSFYFARKGKWLWAGMFAFIATATRLVGVAVLAGVFVEYLVQEHKKISIKNLSSLAIGSLGIGGYLFYLYKLTGDPLSFFHNVEIYGQQRSTQMVLLPQVFYRYIFKIVPHVDYSYFPSVFTTYLELGVASLFLVILLASFRKLRLSYWIYFLAAYLLPPLSGSFSSFPRYVLIIFPAFIFLAQSIKSQNRLVQKIILALLLVVLLVSTSLFMRGYWVS